nr:putative capsid protein [Crucivirus sp.]
MSGFTRVSKDVWDTMSPSEQAALRAQLQKAKPAKSSKKKPVKRTTRRTTTTKRYGGGGRGGVRNTQYICGSGDYFSDAAAGLLKHGLPLVIKGLTGFGDYSVAQNSMIPKLGGDPPIMMSTNNGGFVMRHREYVQDIYATEGFVNNTLAINPGLLSTFPLASQIADTFEQFEIRGMVMEYKSMSSDAVLSAGASSALGTIIFATQYNALDEPFEDKRTMENYEFANSTKPSQSMLHPIECKRSQTPVDLLYVRTGPVETGDLRLYDLGNFNFAVQGCQNAAAGQVLGELWISFELEFFKPKLLPLGGSSTLSDHYTLTGNSLIAVGNPFYTQNGLVRAPESNLGTYIQIAAGSPYDANSIIFPPQITSGKFKVDYYMSATSVSANSPNVVQGTLVNMVSEPFWANGTFYQIAPQPGAAAIANFHFSQVFKITQTAPGVRAGVGYTMTGVMPTGNQSLDIVITLLGESA